MMICFSPNFEENELMMLENKRIYDISPTISKDLAVFPGDCPFSREVVMDFPKGDHLALSNMRSTLHIGAHADAPNHYKNGAPGISERDLSYYMGDCQVLELREDLEYKIEAKRVLFKTGSFPDPKVWNNDFKALNPELISFLHGKGVITVGIDTPSVDKSDSKNLETHKMIAKYDMAILEGLILDKVSQGTYQLIALPLKIQDADASPVRAILLDNIC